MPKKSKSTSSDTNLEFILTLAAMALIIANLALTAYSVSLTRKVIVVPVEVEEMTEEDTDSMLPLF